jgi:hypothetical protein
LNLFIFLPFNDKSIKPWKGPSMLGPVPRVKSSF